MVNAFACAAGVSMWRAQVSPMAIFPKEAMMRLAGGQVRPARNMAAIVECPCFPIITSESPQISEDSMFPEEWVFNGISAEFGEANDFSITIEPVTFAKGAPERANVFHASLLP